MSLEELRKQIRYYDQQYRQGTPLISDTEYDALFQELKRREAESGEPIPLDSPTQQPGNDLAGNAKEVRHRIPMLSIENSYNLGELREFGHRVQKLAAKLTGDLRWIVELKIDGVSLSLIYKDGILVQGITRGNGITGSDVTHNLDMIADVPKTLHKNGTGVFPPILEVRGEVYMRNSDLVFLNEIQQKNGGELYKNPRNITSGTIALKDPKDEKDEAKRSKILAEHQTRKLHFFAHSAGDVSGLTATNHWDFLNEIELYGITPSPLAKCFDTFDQAVVYCESFYNSEDNILGELDFEIDGLVLKVDDFSLRDQLGATGHHPRWIIAYKVEKYEAVSTVREIRVQVGKTGTITPVAEIDPVEIAGTTVSRASLHNAEEIARKDIRVGDIVVVEKAGKIIPHIVRTEKHLRQTELPVYVFPTLCPICGSKLSKDEDGVYIRCQNSACRAQLKEKLRYFAGRSAMDIEGLGEKLVEQLVDTGLVKNFGDVYRLKDKAAELKKLDRVGKKSVENLLQEIEASKTQDLSKLLNALSIRHVGPRTATILAKHFGSLKRLRHATEEELNGVSEIGGIIAKSIAAFFQSEAAMIDDLAANFDTAIDPSTRGADDIIVSKPLDGQTIVVTGTLKTFKRNEIEDVIEKYGGKPSSSVSAKTSFVLAGSEPGSKLAKAEKLGIRIVNEDDFLAMIQQ
ncbi:DNA ligase [Planctomycetales bacterium]|nr:DNA ligase [Planctomycetales bacterium]